MGLGNGNPKQGNRGSNFNFELRHLMLLGELVSNTPAPPPGGLATEATLLDVLAAVDSMRDYEVRLVQDSDTPPVTWLEVRYWDAQSGALGAPVYYPPGSTVAGTPTGALSYINPNSLLTQLLAELVALNAVDYATETTLATMLTEATFSATDFATETTLAALLTAFGTEDFATETTLAALLTAFGSEDFASETTLALLEGKDFATETTLAALAATDFATETTLAALAATDFATETTLASLAATDFATETTLSAIETLLTGASRTPSVVLAVANGSTNAGVKQVSLWFRGTGGTLGGVSVPNGARFTFSADDNNDTVAAIAYTVPSGGAMEVLITYLT